MKWAISFPDEEILIVRPSLGSICAGVKPAAKLLSVLLYRYSIRKESKEDADNINELRSSKGETPTQDTTFRIYRKQEQLVKDMCGEITEKTLHDVAVPTLQLLGYLDIDESSPVHCYDLHPDMVIAAMEAYKKGEKQLEKVLNANLQLEKFLIDPQLEKVLINKKNFQLALEKVLIANRKSSNNKRGRKPAAEKGSDTQNQKPQSNIEIIENNNKTITDAHASSQSQNTPQEKISSSPEPPKEKRVVTPKKSKQPELPHVDEPDLSHLSEQEQQIYASLREKDQTVYLEWSQEKRNVYNNWLGMFGYAVPVDITDGVINTVKRFEPIQPTTEDFLSIRKYATDQEKDKPADKRWYKKRGFKIWDAAREYAGWKSQQAMDGQSEDAPKNNQKMSRDELMAKALAFPTGMDHTTQQYQELQNCLMYLQPNDRAEVTRQRIAKQVAQQKKQVSA